ncbi:hypothetical protein NKI61_28690 [Mesorhizobium sp. M0514]|uniref:hypothetical protein n=1 Tax=Mesorhizobium sp. M0514 TaxID=2956955 RepID=UPI00333A9DAE
MEASISSMEGSRCALLAVAIVTSAAPAHDLENRSSIFEEDQAQNQSFYSVLCASIGRVAL